MEGLVHEVNVGRDEIVYVRVRKEEREEFRECAETRETTTICGEVRHYTTVETIEPSIALAELSGLRESL